MSPALEIIVASVVVAIIIISTLMTIIRLAIRESSQDAARKDREVEK